MSTISTSHFSVPLFTELLHRLHHANVRYNQIAYLYRRIQRPTYHAKRRAYRVGLRIDISKARAAWHDDLVHLSAASALEGTAASAVRMTTKIETEIKEDESSWSPEDACMSNPWPESDDSALGLSPLELGLVNVDDLETCSPPFQGPVPGAPLWRFRPLPEDDCGMEAAMTNECHMRDRVRTMSLGEVS